ncbi:MAG: hypothetical protein M0P35_08370 [Bacteroidales bacterium]|jgi:hypothetical protein|nr:hypothetical protein [Bacteroidales bacterium]
MKRGLSVTSIVVQGCCKIHEDVGLFSGSPWRILIPDWFCNFINPADISMLSTVKCMDNVVSCPTLKFKK